VASTRDTIEILAATACKCIAAGGSIRGHIEIALSGTRQ
jgi:hypothetical protein